MSTDQRNMIHGGLRIFRIVEYDTGKEIFCEDSLDYDTVRPHFLITGSETEERVRMIAAWLDEEIEKAETVFPTYNGKNFSATCKFYLSVDGKVSRMCVLIQWLKFFFASVSNFGIFVVMGQTLFYRASNKLKHHFSNIEQTRMCSSIGDQTRTPFFWLQTNEH